ncbi:hypothetical protein ACOSQ3_004181 [Xanthoceras sorbifolium]
MFTMKVPIYFWGDAVLTATYLINRLPNRTINFETPLSILTKIHPHIFTSNTLPLKTFGCTAFVHIHAQNRNKLDPRALKTIFVGYSPTQKGYRCYRPKTKKKPLSLVMLHSLKKPLISPQTRFRGRIIIKLVIHGMLLTCHYSE